MKANKTSPGVLDESSNVIHVIIDNCLNQSNQFFSKSQKNSHLRLRRSFKSDVDIIIKLVQSLAVFERQPDAINIDADTYAVDGFGNDPLFFSLLLEDVREKPIKVCGMGIFYFGYSTWDGKCLHLEELFVDEQYQGMGAGKFIMYTLADIAEKLSCRRFVWQALEWNKQAREFYDSIGANTLYGWLTLRMEKDAITHFLKTRTPDSNLSESIPPIKGKLSQEIICNAIDACLKQSNQQLKEKLQTTDFSLRRATKTDVGFIMGLVHDLAIYEKELESVHVDSDTYLRDGYGPNPLFYCVLLEDTKETPPHVCGMGLFYFGFSTKDGRFLYLEDLFIKEKFRGLGAGKCIMYTLADIAESLSCSQFVWQALDWNKPARDFYDSIGAKTLNDVLTLRLEGDSIENFLRTRP